MEKKFKKNQALQINSRPKMGLGMAIGAILGALAGWAINDALWGVAMGLLLGGVIGSRGYQRTNLMQYPAHIVRRLIVSAILFFAVSFGAYMLLRDEPGRDLSLLFAIAPSLAGLFFAYTIGSAIASLDELQRRIQVEAIAIGFGITAIVTLSYGWLGLVDVPQPSMLYISLLMVLSWGIGKLWTMWKYR